MEKKPTNPQTLISFKKLFLAILMIAASLMSCDQEEIKSDASSLPANSALPAIVLSGRKMDTAYLYATYKDPGAWVSNYVEGTSECADSKIAETSDWVNTRLPGTCFLTYCAADKAGAPIAPATRTVHVVENSAGFLNGNYNVAFSCTAAIAGSPSSTVTTDNYTATIGSGSENHHFELDALKIGSEYVMHNTILIDYSIEIFYFSPDYHQKSAASGTLSATKDTFTIESATYPFFCPTLTYTCKNVYTRQLIIK